MKITIKNIIKEDNNKVDRYINRISQLIQKPYIYNLKRMDVPMEYWDDILSNIFNEPVKWKKPGSILIIVDERNNILYEELEREDGIRWEKQIVDHKNNIIFYEDSRGVWEKIDYDYYENGGVLRKQIKGSDGYWSISEWDKDGKRLYFSDSKGELIDERPTNNINESVVDKKERYYNHIVDYLIKNTQYKIETYSDMVPRVNIVYPDWNVSIEYSLYDIEDDFINYVHDPYYDPPYHFRKGSKINTIYNLTDSEIDLVVTKYINRLGNKLHKEMERLNTRY